jgi:predicted ATP-grasp superfamily ATP-dependent carboligase
MSTVTKASGLFGVVLLEEAGMKRALIVEQGYSRGAVAATRALADDGWTVGVGSPGASGLAARSRACRIRHHVPPAHRDSASFLQGVQAAVRSHGYEVVFGAGEAEVLALSAGRDCLTRAVVPHAPHETVVAALNKDRLEAAAQSVGLSVPETADLSGTSDEKERFIVKATAHAHPDRPGAPPRVDTNMVVGATAARRRVEELESLGADARVQRFYDGTLLAYSAVTDRSGRVVADSMQEASRIWPPGAGASCRAETVSVDPRVSEPAEALLRELGWFGLAELQFIRPTGGRPRIIDLNGRFYGIPRSCCGGGGEPSGGVGSCVYGPAVSAGPRKAGRPLPMA